MKSLRPEEIIKYLKDNIEPIQDSIDGDGYRAAVYLTDGTYLPCVIFRSPGPTVKQATKRFEEELSGKSIFGEPSGEGYYRIVENFTTKGNCVNWYDIAIVEPSKNSFPINIIRLICGETKMGWTGFVAKMKDGKQFAFGTGFYFYFFDLPQGYSANDITEIINHTYLNKDGELKSYHSKDVYDVFTRDLVFQSKPFFDCFIGGP